MAAASPLRACARASTRPHAPANFANRPVMVSSLRDDLSVMR